MNEKKKLQPKVRFREFTGENAPDWEQRKLGEVTERVKGNDGIIHRELADISLLRIHVAFRMQASYPVVGVAENFQHLAADTGHNRHIKYDIDGIRYLNTDFGERRTDRSHGIRDDIHGSAFIGAAGDIIELRVHFLWVTPVVGRTGVLFFP